jgi:HSP20 family molecular chaperone IbpA
MILRAIRLFLFLISLPVVPLEDGGDKDHILVRRANAVSGLPVKVAFVEDLRKMTRVTAFSNPLLLGFDAVERTLERVAKTGDGYPPYNIERLSPQDGGERLRITLAVAGFAESDLEVTLEDNQLVIRGRQNDESEREYLHRGIAARQFQRCFVLADGMRVAGAELKNGLLSVDLDRPEPERLVRRINIAVSE